MDLLKMSMRQPRGTNERTTPLLSRETIKSKHISYITKNVVKNWRKQKFRRKKFVRKCL